MDLLNLNMSLVYFHIFEQLKTIPIFGGIIYLNTEHAGLKKNSRKHFEIFFLFYPENRL